MARHVLDVEEVDIQGAGLGRAYVPAQFLLLERGERLVGQTGAEGRGAVAADEAIAVVQFAVGIAAAVAEDVAVVAVARAVAGPVAADQQLDPAFPGVARAAPRQRAVAGEALRIRAEAVEGQQVDLVLQREVQLAFDALGVGGGAVPALVRPAAALDPQQPVVAAIAERRPVPYVRRAGDDAATLQPQELRQRDRGVQQPLRVPGSEIQGRGRAGRRPDHVALLGTVRLLERGQIPRVKRRAGPLNRPYSYRAWRKELRACSRRTRLISVW